MLPDEPLYNSESEIFNNRPGSLASDVSRKRSNTSLYYTSVVEPEVKGKLSTFLRIEPGAENTPHTRWRLKQKRIKTIMYFFFDFAVLGVSLFAAIAEHDYWSVCIKKFNLWTLTVVFCGTLSLIFDIADWFLLQKIKKHRQQALSNESK